MIGLLSGALVLLAFALLAWTLALLLSAGKPAGSMLDTGPPSPLPARQGALRVAFVAAACLAVGVSAWMASAREVLPVRLTLVGMALVLTAAVCNWGLSTLLARRREQAEEVLRLTRVLAAARTEFRSCFDRQKLCEHAARRIAEVLQVSPVTAYLARDGVFRPVSSTAVQMQESLVFSSTSLLVRQMEAARQEVMWPLQWGMEKGEGPASPGSLLAPRSQVEAEGLRMAGLSGRWVVPWWGEHSIVGFWVLGHRASGNDYSAREVWVLGRLAGELAEALSAMAGLESHAASLVGTMRQAQERELSAALKGELYSREALAVPGVECSGAHKASANGETECYMLTPSTAGAADILLARSSGTGSEAPIRLARLQGWYTGWDDPDCGAFRRQIEQLRATLRPGEILDAFHGRIDGRRRTIRYVNAGFPSPFVLRRSPEGSAVLRLNAGESLSPFQVTEGEFAIEPGDVLVAASRGVAELRNEDGEEWGEGALIETIMSWQGQRARDAAELTLRTALSYAGGREPERDLSLVVAKVHSIEPDANG